MHIENNFIRADSYKYTHSVMYPPHLTALQSYIESRGGKFKQSLFFGLQYLLKDVLSKPITAEMVEEIESFTVPHNGVSIKEDAKRILNKHGGYLPVRIRAVKEGTVLPTKNALVIAESTDPELAWVESFAETMLLRAVWYPTTVATLSWTIKQKIKAGMLKTCDNLDKLLFMLHDFGGRGVSSSESAIIGGGAHLVNFMGTDTTEALWGLRRYYHENMAGRSIPAAEHSAITAWGRHRELEAYSNIMDHYLKTGNLVAIVSDSYDLFRAVNEMYGTSLKEKIKNSGGTVVIRPDSGDPTMIPILTIEALMEKFGYTINSKGYKVLPSYIRVIQGDGINEDTIQIIIDRMIERGLSLDNIAFGMGGALLQILNRDDMKFAMKASAGLIDGQWIDIQKDPITDQGKKSKAGRLALIKDHVGFETIRIENLCGREDLLEPVWDTGELLRDQNLTEIRALSEVF